MSEPRRRAKDSAAVLAWFVKLEIARAAADPTAEREARSHLRRLGVDVLHLDDREPVVAADPAADERGAAS